MTDTPQAYSWQAEFTSGTTTQINGAAKSQWSYDVGYVELTDADGEVVFSAPLKGLSFLKRIEPKGMAPSSLATVSPKDPHIDRCVDCRNGVTRLHPWRTDEPVR